MTKETANETLTIRIGNREKQQLHDLSRALGKTKSAIVRQLIEDRLQRRGDYR